MGQLACVYRLSRGLVLGEELLAEGAASPCGNPYPPGVEIAYGYAPSPTIDGGDQLRLALGGGRLRAIAGRFGHRLGSSVREGAE